MPTILHGLELVFSKARTILELKGVLVLLLFCLDVISELNQKTPLWRPGHFPALHVKEYGSGCSAPYVDLLLCSVRLPVWDALVWAGSVVSNSGSWDMLNNFVDLDFVLLFSLRIPIFILFWFYFTQYCDLEGI